MGQAGSVLSWTPLIVAVAHGQPAALKALLAAGARSGVGLSPTVGPFTFATPLTLARDEEVIVNEPILSRILRAAGVG